MVADITTTMQSKWTKWKAWTTGRLHYEHQFQCMTVVLRAMHEVRWQAEGTQKTRSSVCYWNQLQLAQKIQHHQSHLVRHALKSSLPVITQRQRTYCSCLSWTNQTGSDAPVTACISSLDVFVQTPEQQSQDHRRCLDACWVERGHLEASPPLCSASRFWGTLDG